MATREGPTDIYRVCEGGVVYAEDEVVAKWAGWLKVMTFRGEGKDIEE